MEIIHGLCFVAILLTAVNSFARAKATTQVAKIVTTRTATQLSNEPTFLNASSAHTTTSTSSSASTQSSTVSTSATSTLPSSTSIRKENYTETYINGKMFLDFNTNTSDINREVSTKLATTLSPTTETLEHTGDESLIRPLLIGLGAAIGVVLLLIFMISAVACVCGQFVVLSMPSRLVK